MFSSTSGINNTVTSATLYTLTFAHYTANHGAAPPRGIMTAVSP
ncbi:uncharacterized, partial [Tachysurus ichikawai]